MAPIMGTHRLEFIVSEKLYVIAWRIIDRLGLDDPETISHAALDIEEAIEKVTKEVGRRGISRDMTSDHIVNYIAWLGSCRVVDTGAFGVFM